MFENVESNLPTTSGGIHHLQYKAIVTEVISDYVLNVEIIISMEEMMGVTNLERFFSNFRETPKTTERDDFILFKGEVVQIFFDEEERRNRATAETIAQYVEVGTTIEFWRLPSRVFGTDFEHDPPRVPAYAIVIYDEEGEYVTMRMPG